MSVQHPFNSRGSTYEVTRLPLSEIHCVIPAADSNSALDMTLSDGTSVGRHGHDQIGALYLSRLGFSPTVCELVKDHVVAKRYLTTVEKEYLEGLSSASKASLEFQARDLR